VTTASRFTRRGALKPVGRQGGETSEIALGRRKEGLRSSGTRKPCRQTKVTKGAVAIALEEVVTTLATSDVPRGWKCNSKDEERTPSPVAAAGEMRRENGTLWVTARVVASRLFIEMPHVYGELAGYKGKKRMSKDRFAAPTHGPQA